ncbi:hypothetical protein Agau_L101172 [Agrobacterium tumefaciens F2]|nr:hypothetical protein Agau_L101172 [Agrobacterium tumefaciens F2]
MRKIAVVKKKKPSEKAVAIKGLRDAYEKFNAATGRAILVSDRNVGQFHTGRQRRALMVFFKMTAHNLSMLELCAEFIENPDDETVLVDHFSIATLARASIDAALMTMYISEPSLTRTQWDFRRQLLFLHDANNRSRFLKPLKKYGDIPFFETSDTIRDGIKEKIRTLGATLLLSEIAITDYQNGFSIFIDGVRGAAREAKWDIDMFEFHQSYLSAYVHTHPVSFMRADEHDLTFPGISNFQADFLHFVYTSATEYTDSVTARMDVFSEPGKGDPNGHLE